MSIDVIKYAALPTWLLVKFLIHGIPEHPYAKEYPTLASWALGSPGPFRLFDLALYVLALALLARTVRLFF